VKRYFANFAAAIVGILVFLSTKPALSQGENLLPDMVTFRPSQFSIEVVGGKRLLRLSNEVVNQGRGTLELYAEKPDSGDCDGNGDPANDRLVYQRIFQDANGDHIYTRKTDKKYTDVRAGCMVFHPLHDHYHLNDFARYELKTLDSTNTTLAQSIKVSFCIIDSSHPYGDLLGSPTSRYYKSCGRNFKQGISVGWGDVYRSTLADQTIDITGIPDGNYCVFSTADPTNKLIESDDDNNSKGTKITLSTNTTVTPPVTTVTSDASSCPL